MRSVDLQKSSLRPTEHFGLPFAADMQVRLYVTAEQSIVVVLPYSDLFPSLHLGPSCPGSPHEAYDNRMRKCQPVSHLFSRPLINRLDVPGVGEL